MKRYISLILILIFFTIISSSLPTAVSAQTSSPSADLQQKIDQLKQEIASKAAQLKNDINHKLQNRLIAGLVQSKTDSQIIITTTDKSQTALIDKFTDYEYGNLKESINKDDFVVALGDIDDKGNLLARRVVKQIPPVENAAQYVFGTIETASQSAVLIKEKDSSEGNFLINSDTNFKSDSGDFSVRSLTKDQTIILVANPGKSGTLIARFIYLVKEAPAVSASSTKPSSDSASVSALRK